MIIATTNDLPGHEVEEVLGEVFGLTVRSRNVGSQIGASLKSLFGGELRGITKMLAQGREKAIARLVEEAEARGGNAIFSTVRCRQASAPFDWILRLPSLGPPGDPGRTRVPGGPSCGKGT